MIFLIDHNLNGHALILLGSIANQGWLDIIPIRFVTFAQKVKFKKFVSWLDAQPMGHKKLHTLVTTRTAL